MATHSSIPAWRIPVDRGAWWATVHGVGKGWTLLKRLSTAHIKNREATEIFCIAQGTIFNVL